MGDLAEILDVFKNPVIISFNDIPPHESPLQVSSSPIPIIQKCSINSVTLQPVLMC